ncbi:MAG: dihydrofolate reductase [Candidatus Paceibacterota bacterium]
MRKKKSVKIKYTGYVAVSIDGRIAKSGKSGTDWTSKEDWNFFQKSLLKFNAVIVGYNTYKVSEVRLKKRNTIVFTSKVKNLKTVGTVTFFNIKYSNIFDFLKEMNYKKVAILGGPKIYNFFLQNKMLHELFITIEPYVFTTGVPMFLGDKFTKYNFVLKSIKKLNKKGTLLLKYKYAN